MYYRCKTDRLKNFEKGNYYKWINSFDSSTTIIDAKGVPNIFGNTAFKKHFEPYSEDIKNNNNERVNNPSHYTWLKDKCGIEVIDITRHLNFNIGNAIKYILRAGHKSEEGYSNKDKTIEDLSKAIWYLQDEIKRIKNVSS